MVSILRHLEHTSSSKKIRTFGACSTSMCLEMKEKNRRGKLASAFNSQVKRFSHVELEPIAFVGLNVYLFLSP